MEHDQEDQGAIDESQGSDSDTEQSIGESRDSGLWNSLDGDEGELDDSSPVPESIREVKKRRLRRKERRGDYSIPVKDLGKVQADSGIIWCIKLGWRPTKEQIQRYRKIAGSRKGHDPKPGFSAKIGRK